MARLRESGAVRETLMELEQRIVDAQHRPLDEAIKALHNAGIAAPRISLQRHPNRDVVAVDGRPVFEVETLYPGDSVVVRHRWLLETLHDIES